MKKTLNGYAVEEGMAMGWAVGFIVIILAIICGGVMMAMKSRGEVHYEYTDLNGETGLASRCYTGDGNLYCRTAENGYLKVQSYRVLQSGE